MQYYINGQEVAREHAYRWLMDKAPFDIDPEEVNALWNNRGQEEARDTLFDLSDCTLEIVAD